MNAADFRAGAGSNLTVSSEENGFTYIFTIPAESAQRNCRGNMVAIQYCYQVRNRDLNNRRIVFNFVHLNRSESELQFEITGSFTVQTTPHDGICTVSPELTRRRICCDTTTLDSTDRFPLPSSSYTFAVTIVDADVRPLVFEGSAKEYQSEHLQAFLGTSPPATGSIITLDQNAVVTNESLLLLRFFIGKFFGIGL